ncbi:MAG: histidinol-phosphatase [Bacillota bacterium]
MLADYHVHLERGPYTLEWLEQFLRQAERVGIAELGIVEHLYRFVEARPALYNDWVAKRQTQHLDDFLELIARAKQRGWPVKLGLEVDYIPGKEDAIRQVTQGLPLDFLIGSVHWLGDWCFDADAASWEGRDLLQVYRQYYDVLAQAVESGLFDILGHPGNIAYFGFTPRWDDRRRIEASFLERIRPLRRQICLEVNTGGLLRPGHTRFPSLGLLRHLRSLDFDITLSSDAHRPEDVGYAFADTVALLRQMTFQNLCHFRNRRQRLVRF